MYVCESSLSNNRGKELPGENDTPNTKIIDLLRVT